MELVYMDGKKEPYTLSSIVAECAEVKHRHLKILLNKHREDFESFGKVQFKISPSESGQNVRDYILNEQQATLTKLINRVELKEELKISDNTLNKWESQGLRRYQPPDDGARIIFYLVDDIRRFMGVENG